LQTLVETLCDRFASKEEGLLVLTDLAVLIAAADQTIDTAEMDALKTSLQAMLGSHVAPLLARVVVEESRTRVHDLGPEESARQIGAKLAASGVAEDGLRLAFSIASSSEGVSDIERSRIDVVAAAAGVSKSRVEALAAELPRL